MNTLRFTAPLREPEPLSKILLISFFLCGLVNNFGYVVMLSGALDIIHSSGEEIGAGVILLADIGPTLLIKLSAPLYMEKLSFGLRLGISSLSGVVSFLLAASSSSLVGKLIGVSFASICSGLGEITFLSLQAYFHKNSIAGWGSGTGCAGLVGAGVYLAFTSLFGLSPTLTLYLLSPVSISTFVIYYFILQKHKPPKEDLDIFSHSENDENENHLISQRYQANPLDSDGSIVGNPHFSSSQTNEISESIPESTDTRPLQSFQSIVIIDDNNYSPTVPKSSPHADWSNPTYHDKIAAIRQWIVPYMIPLFLVYLAEYLINFGVTSVIVYEDAPFDAPTHFRLFSFIYQTGVFISRSSVTVFPVKRLYIPSCGQIVLFIFLVFHVLLFIFPSVWLILVLIFIEGLLGGAVYVGAFYQISQKVEPQGKREFAMGVVSVSDSLGITLAGILAIPLEAFLLANGHHSTTRTF